jgi:hypothetical protein
MNERIRELSKDADLDWHKHWNDDETNRLQQFAELIVRECCEVAHCNFHVDGLTLGTILREHFGVKDE